MRNRLLLSAVILFSFLIANAQESLPIRVWPRLPEVQLPTALHQFIYLEIPRPATDGPARLTLRLPDHFRITAVLQGDAPALPARNRSFLPEKFRQDGRIAEFEFAAGSFPADRAYAYLPVAADVQTPPGKHEIEFRWETAGTEPASQIMPLIVHPALSGEQPRNLEIIACDYPELQEEFIPLLLNQARSAGITAIHRMRHAAGGVTARAGEYGIRCGLVFFIHQIQKHFAETPLPGGDRADPASLVELLNRPETFKAMMREFFRDKLSAGYDMIVYDAERHAIADGKAVGDFSSAALAEFRNFAGLPAETELNATVILEKYRREWAAFNCELTRKFAALFREFLDESHPALKYQVYSGYQLDSGPYRDRTRERYSVDWALLRDIGFDAALAGYSGAVSNLKNTAEALDGLVPFHPGEMYAENFNREKIVNRRYDQWSVRLMQSFLAGSRRGLMIWYLNVLDGNALLAIDRVTKVLARTEEIILNGVDDIESVRVQPAAEKSAVTVIRQGGHALIVALNPTEKPKKLRLTLTGFQVKGFTGELALADVETGEKIRADGNIELQIPAYSFRAIQLFEDGN